jgi:NTP pyrophosphatase (non-canonical NTP hydrolase)
MEHKLVKFFTPEQNVLKLIEELTELQEVMIKYLTKSPAFKPKKDKMVEEMGDVMFRMAIVCEVLGIEEELVVERSEHKWEIMDTWVDNKIKEQKV